MGEKRTPAAFRRIEVTLPVVSLRSSDREPFYVTRQESAYCRVGGEMQRTSGAGHTATKRKPGPFFSRLSDRDFTDAVRIAGDKVKTQRAVFEEWAAEEGVDPRRPCDEWPGTVRAAYLNLGFAEEVFGLVMDASAARSKQKAPNPLKSGARAVARARQGPDRAREALPDGSPALRTLVARLAQSPLRGRAAGYSDAILQRAKAARP
jgi:hypothetical protein